jgi:1,2-diacylglycerol 3-beta-glucosyltransferase
VADLLGAVISGTPPGMWPFSLVALGLSGFSMAMGCARPSEGPELPRPTPFNLALGIVYLIHWFVVIPWVVLKMALLPKSLVWAKTVHGAQRLDCEDDQEPPGNVANIEGIEVAAESSGG